VGFKVKYNSSGVDRSRGNGIPPNPGLYLGTVKGVKYRKEKNDIELMVQVKSGDHKGYPLWRYISLDPSSDWKLDQALLAVGVDTVNKPKGTFDIDNFLNKDVMMRVKGGTYNDEYRPELAALLPVPDDLDEDDEDEDDEDFDDEELDDEDEDEDDEEDEDEDEDEEEDEDDEDEDEDEEDEDEDEEEEPPPPPAKKATKKAPAAAAKKAPAKKAAAASKAKRPPKYETMELDELKAECTKRGINAKGNKAAIIARLRANDDDPFSD
jgi:outer membrane biosynthesis protein TonB